MKALIIPTQNNFVTQVEPDDKIFEVAEPLYWLSCPDDVTDGWYYLEGKFVPPPPYIPTIEENKQAAIQFLQQTDWTTIPDVADPALANPYLVNQSEFIEWRSQIRAIAINPIAGNLDIFSQMPKEVWS